MGYLIISLLVSVAMRLDKYLCHSSSLTRSHAQRVIRSGQVSVDGEVVKDPSYKIPDNAEVVWREQTLQLTGHRYFMLNKPVGVVCAATDARHKTVIDLLDVDNKKGLHVAGRLDIDTTGLVLITDDGDWSHRLTSPRRQCNKRYRVRLAEPIDVGFVECFAEGIELRNEKKKTRPARLEIIQANEVLLTLNEGKYHQVKRMFAAGGNHVASLHRESIGAIVLDPDLQPGHWRMLTREEIDAI
ncbi:16S rRNA pseudouridine(516) synthase RsuA [Kaarinaea lacus]